MSDQPSDRVRDTVDVSVVIVSYNTIGMTRECLRTLMEQTRSLRFETILIDNNSRDGSAEMVEREFPGVKVIRNTDNKGFAAANNQGFEVARGRYLLLLNSDTEVLDRAVERTVEWADRHEDVGVVGCRARHRDGRQQNTVFREVRLKAVLMNIFVPYRWMRRSARLGRQRYIGLDLDKLHDVDNVAGCYMLVRREVYEKVGGFDDQFFMYGEEADWCTRIRRAGWRVVYYPDATIIHHGGASAKQIPARMACEMARSQLLLIQKHRGKLKAWIANAMMLVRDLPRGAAWAVLSVAPGLRSHPMRGVLATAAGRIPMHVRGLFKTDWRR